MTGKTITKGIAKDIIIVVIGVLIIWLGLRVVFGTENPFYVVSSGSMVPVLQVFDVIIVQGNEPFEDIQKGDIIVFNRPDGHDRVIVHRVAEIINDNPKTIRTKGDANPSSIPGTDLPITKDEYIGKVAYVIPQVGYVTRILMPPVNYVIIAVIVGIMIFKQISKNKKAKEFSLSTKDDNTNKTFENSTSDDKLANLPKDNAYTEFEKARNLDTVNQSKGMDSKERLDG